MAQLTQSQRAQIALSNTFKGRVKVWLQNRANFWKDAVAVTRADVNKQLQKRKRFGEQILLEFGFVDNILVRFTEYYLMQYTTDPAQTETVSGELMLLESQLDSAAFNAAYDYYAGVEAGDSTDQEIDW